MLTLARDALSASECILGRFAGGGLTTESSSLGQESFGVVYDVETGFDSMVILDDDPARAGARSGVATGVRTSMG
jgi:hypothetical protein